MDKLFFNPGSL